MELIKEIRKFDFSIYNTDDIEEQQSLKNEGYIECIYINEKPEEKEFFETSNILKFNDDKQIYERTWVQKVDTLKINTQISILKQQLADTDYKVVKNMEYQMAMMSSVEPNTIILDLYDPKELHNERQALRDKINELENLLKTN